MKQSLVLRSVFNRKVKQFKKEKSLPHHQALDEAARFFGFSNYKNYLNTLEASPKKTRPSKPNLFEEISAEKDQLKKVALAQKFIVEFKPPMPMLLDLLDFFSDSDEAVQVLCEISRLKRDIQNYLWRDCQDGEWDCELDEHFVAKSLSVSNVRYQLNDDEIIAEGDFRVDVEFEYEVDEKHKRYPHFHRPPYLGNFELSIDRNKKITVEDMSSGEDYYDKTYLSSFDPIETIDL